MKDIITHPTFLWIAGSLVVSGLLLWAVSYVVASYFVYVKTLKRRSKDQWSREVPQGLEPDAQKMYDIGLQWDAENASYKQDVHIVRDGLNLYGEYYDFGYDKTAMILSGRTEGLRYSYYFAIPYAKNGCNVLVVDPRAHGLSDGSYNTVGFEESLDDVAWINYLQQNHGVNTVILHGICIGAAGGMLAATNPDCPSCVKAIVTEGMFPCFAESVKNHLIEKKKTTKLVHLVDFWKKKFTGHSMKYGPINVIDKLQIPLLMLHSQEDAYSKPEFAQKLYDLAGSKQKRLVWFSRGKHSMLRITDTDLYDLSITQFLQELSQKGDK